MTVLLFTEFVYPLLSETPWGDEGVPGILCPVTKWFLNSQSPRSFKVHSACACALAVRPDLGSSTRRNMARATVKVPSKKLSRVKRNMYLRLFARAHSGQRTRRAAASAHEDLQRHLLLAAQLQSSWHGPRGCFPPPHDLSSRPARRIEGREVS